MSEESEFVERIIYQVADLNLSVRHILETNFTHIWVEGEASNVKVPASGHVYFTLKDARAQVRCVCFRQTVMHLDNAIEDGAQLLVYAKVSVYEARGDYQLLVTDVQLAGAGALQRAFLALKDKLHKRGWFDLSHKQPLPSMPRCVGVITSATGAAVRDVLRVLNRRFPAINIIIYPSLVQGEKATQQLVRALNSANERAECDVLLLVRGGGSLEDLWAFNDETLADAIFHSSLPVVTGIGHQVDFTIADFVCDWRAATPSAAAECVSHDQHEVWAHIKSLCSHFEQLTLAHIRTIQLSLEYLSKRLVHPGDQIHRFQVLSSQLRERLDAMIRLRLESLRRRLIMLTSRLMSIDMLSVLQHKAAQLQSNIWQCQRLMEARLHQSQHDFSKAVKSLDLLSPLGVLARGYALVECNGRIVMDSSQVALGECLQLRLAKGCLQVVVSGD